MVPADLAPEDPNRYAGNASSIVTQQNGRRTSMIGVIAIACGLGVCAAAAALLFLRRRRMYSGLENVTVSRQWLIEHQADE